MEGVAIVIEKEDGKYWALFPQYSVGGTGPFTSANTLEELMDELKTFIPKLLKPSDVPAGMIAIPGFVIDEGEE